ncbi:MAG: hypothetical protein S4CHLAM45_04140 [Chlamydiales bacterium]|nr:hypothetical protein [Chlamydiales bacterium]MCH9619268.1 hypothetical protein [Chlamydiales bacterium]MCH9622530.1 hypothetical protein [Chlamydiales bacterium]
MRLACLFAIFLVGCIHYKVPNVGEGHPACCDITTTQFELSPILEINPQHPLSDP